MGGNVQKMIAQDDLAGIQYFGIAGVTSQCLDAITRLIHFGDDIHHAKLLSTQERHHSFLLTINYDDQVAIKSGFASGYIGTGSHGLSTALQMLIRHDVDIDEYAVTNEFMERLDSSCLLSSDLEELTEQKAIKPDRYYDYIIDCNPDWRLGMLDNDEKLRFEFPATIPLRIVDSRIIDLALAFDENPDYAIISAFRRLEDIIRKRTNLKEESGSRLFAKAFQGENQILHWENETKSENISRANMFSGIFGAYRNPRSHRNLQEAKMSNIYESSF